MCLCKEERRTYNEECHYRDACSASSVDTEPAHIMRCCIDLSMSRYIACELPQLPSHRSALRCLGGKLTPVNPRAKIGGNLAIALPSFFVKTETGSSSAIGGGGGI